MNRQILAETAVLYLLKIRYHYLKFMPQHLPIAIFDFKLPCNNINLVWYTNFYESASEGTPGRTLTVLIWTKVTIRIV